MKKIILSIAILLICSISYNTYAQGVGLGIKAGANLANQSMTNWDTSTKTGFHGGAYIIIAFSQKWAIQPEVMYSAQGSEITDIDEVNDFNYLSIPILIRWKPISFLSIEAGPQFSSLLDAKNKSGDSIKEDFKDSDFGFAVGARIHLPLGLNVGARYIWGFTNVSDLGDDTSVKNTTAQIYAGWTIFGAK